MTLGALGVTLGLACAPPGTPAPTIRVALAPEGPDTRLTLLAPPDLRVNARLVPALELPDGSILRFDAGRLTADSAYFAEPPTARLAGRRDRIRGTLRASVCRTDEMVCRSVMLEL